MSNLKTVEEYIAYHIYIPTPEYKLNKGGVYNTNTINRDFSNCGAEKQNMSQKVKENTNYLLAKLACSYVIFLMCDIGIIISRSISQMGDLFVYVD